MPEIFTGYNTFPIAPAPGDSDYPDIDAATRFALTGDSQSADPTTAELAYPTPRELRKLIEANPCLGDKDTLVLSSDLTVSDLQNLNEAAGAMVALSLLGTAAGWQKYGVTAAKTVTKIRHVEITKDNSAKSGTLSQSDVFDYLKAMASESLSRISCIAAYRASLPVTPMFGLAGRRRAIEAGGCNSPIYNGYRRRC